MADFSYSDDAELQALNNAVLADPDEFENWEKLVRAAETQEDGNTLNRNSSPQAIAATRNVYDGFLGRFPLFFGYWKKYADLEFSIAGPEAAEMVYERGVASVPTSVDMWQNYCGFKSETNHDLDQIRELFERGAESCGLDFMSHPFWDKYLEFEGRLAPDDRSFGVLSRLIHIPLYQYARYFERFRAACVNRPAAELAPPEVFRRLEAQVASQPGPKGKNPADADRELRALLEEHHMSIFNNTQTETTKRWQYEQEIKRPYFHVTDLDEPQLENWRKYLDFEDANGGYERTKFLYERCLVTAASYDEFWTRYALWMASQPQKRPEEVRNIYQRASCVFVPIAKPAIRLLWAKFEETAGRADVAADILEAITLVLPNHLEAIMALVYLRRRREGKDAALQTLRKYTENPEVTPAVRGALVAESARMVYAQSEDASAARKIFTAAQGSNLDNRPFWMKWFFFETQLPIAGKPDEHYQRVKAVYTAVRQKSRLDADTIADLTTYYQAYLQEYGPEDAMEEYMQLEREIRGPTTSGLSGKQPPGLENGLAGAATHENTRANGGGAHHASMSQSVNGQAARAGY